MDENFFTNESYEKYNKFKINHYIGKFNSEKEEYSDIYDSLNNNEKLNIEKNDNTNINNFSINNEDSVLQDAFISLSNIPKTNNKKEKDSNIKKEKEKVIFNNYSIDNNPDNNNSVQINNEEENVNLGVSFSKISEPEKYIKKNNRANIINEENNNQGVITPNTSIYNMSETITKKSEQINNININNIEKNKSESSKNIESINIVKYNTNQNEEEKKLNFNINYHFSGVIKIEENEKDNDIIKSNNNNIESNNNINLNDIIEKNIALKKSKKHKNNNIISKRFELIKKNKKQLANIDTNSSTPLNTNSSNILLKSIFKESNNDKFDKSIKTSMSNSINENNNYIYLCPYCNKETPEIIKLAGIQENINSPTIDRISISCSCGNYNLDLIEYINILEQKKTFQNLKENCYNENHEPIKASIYCSKCNKWFCDQCLNFHKSLLPDHIITPTKIPKFSKCLIHKDYDILFFCNKCRIGICEKCKLNSHGDHLSLNINDYFNNTYNSLPFKTFEELNEYIEHCNRISEKEKNSYINYIEDMINKFNELKNDIINNYNISKKRRTIQQKLIKYLFGNFICFNDNYTQIKNMNSINYICPTLFLYNDINFIKNANNYSLYLKKESFIEINPDKKLDKEQIKSIFDKYKSVLKEIINNNNSNSIDTINNIYNNNKIDINTLQSESNYIYPSFFKIYNNTGIYYGEINNNKRNGIGKQFNNKDEYEGIWDNGDIIKGKAIYFSDQGNIIYEGEFKDGLENGYGEKIYPNNRVYKGIFINGKIDMKYEIQKKLEIPDN